MTTNNETDIIAASTISEIGLAVPRSVSVTPDPEKYPSPGVSNPYTFKITKNVAFSAIYKEDWSGGGK